MVKISVSIIRGSCSVYSISPEIGSALQVNGSNVATEAYADSAAASAQTNAEAHADSAAAAAQTAAQSYADSVAGTLPSHRHTVEADGNTATTEYTGYAGT